MQEAGKALLLIGTVILVIGGILLLSGRLGLGQRPGDIVVRGRRVTLFLPLATSLLLSLVATLLLWLLFRK